jgi:hypothetical protein
VCLFSQAGFSERFEREVRAVAALIHPNIRQLHDVGTNYPAMELIDGSQAGPVHFEPLILSKKCTGFLQRLLADRNQQADADADRLIVAAPKRVIVCRLDIPPEPALWRRPKHEVQRDFAGH